MNRQNAESFHYLIDFQSGGYYTRFFQLIKFGNTPIATQPHTSHFGSLFLKPLGMHWLILWTIQITNVIQWN